METSTLTDMDVSKLKVPELRKELKSRGLSTVGNKNELLVRLQSAIKNEKSEDPADTTSVDDLEDDLLNEDEDDESHIEENDSVLQDFESTLDKSPQDSKLSQVIKRKSSEGTANGSSIKKILLNRTEIISDIVANGEQIPTVAVVEDNNDKKVIKLSELSAKERLEMRAKKFGTPLSGDAKKEVRAERFGINKSPAVKAKTGNVPITKETVASADVLKQRAERFGVKTSTTLTNLENQEKLEKRKARFGIAPTNGSTDAKTKAQQRLERFKQPVK